MIFKKLKNMDFKYVQYSTKSLNFLFCTFLFIINYASAQQKSSLSIDQIMQGNAFIGTSPSNISWSEDGRKIYFMWNPEQAKSDSLYVADANGKNIRKVSPSESRELPAQNGDYNRARTKKVYEKNGDLFLLDLKSGKVQQITNTVDRESVPAFSFDEQKVSFISNNNLYIWQISNGQLTQLTDFRKGQKRPDPETPKNAQEKWLREQQTTLLDIVKQREENKAIAQAQAKKQALSRSQEVYIGDKNVDNLILSPDERFITYRLSAPAGNAKSTQVPNYITASGFTEDIPARTKVGAPLATYEMGVLDLRQDTAFTVSFKSVPGIEEVPTFRQEKSVNTKEKTPAQTQRPVVVFGPVWSDNGNNAVVILRAQDNKDRWIMAFNPADRSLTPVYRQHDDAWIGGPGIGYGANDIGWMPDNEQVYFQSEDSGYSHLYTANVKTGAKKTLTSGNYEISNLQLSRDKKHWYFNANKLHPGDVQFYRMPLQGGEMVQLTSGTGNHEVTLSPDEKSLAIRYSTTNKPWELYLMPNNKGAKPKQITQSLTKEFQQYNWREPEVISFKATDGADVYARLYRPAKTAVPGPAVIFVHGAGYLQNAHKWWSQYFREYMFHNFLVDNGYTVMDIDYRGSAGYGRDVRTGIYRHMGGKDLSDHVDGAKLLAAKYNVDPKRIGIYGGSYGGFITLMAMFTQADVFAAGGALRSVTDWAHYNHGYTSNILNEPFTDSLAFVRSSPIYFAEGLKGALLMCHGMVDTNVHFQDIVRLTQRLIELKKENWELAVYPVENHGFEEPSSWTDEYKRIFKLFETNLKKGL